MSRRPVRRMSSGCRYLDLPNPGVEAGVLLDTTTAARPCSPMRDRRPFRRGGHAGRAAHDLRTPARKRVVSPVPALLSIVTLHGRAPELVVTGGGGW